MSGFFKRLSASLDRPLVGRSRLAVLAAALVLIPTFVVPLWHMTFVAQQYPEGLNLYVYSHNLVGGDDGNDLTEINVLNHYIGMAPLDRASLTDLDWIPFLFAGMIILALRTAVIGKVGSMIDLLVLTTYAGIFGFGRLYFKLYTFGHNLDPRAPVTVDPFMPVMWGQKQIANFLTDAGPGLGTVYVAIFATGLTLLLLAHLVIGRRNHVKATASAAMA